MPDILAIIHAGGPYAIATSVCLTVVWMVAKGRLIPKNIHDQRLADKQQLIDFMETTANRALTANAPREQEMTKLINRMTEVLAAHDRAAGR